MHKNKLIASLILSAALSCNEVIAQNIKEEIRSAGINSCECINNSKYYSRELVDSVFTACQSKHFSKFNKQDYSAYEFDHFGNPIGELLNSYLNVMIAYCPNRMAEFKESKKLTNSDEYVTGKYIKIEQTGIFEEIELLGECGETYHLIDTTNYIAKELLSPTTEQLGMSYYQFIIESTKYPVKLYFKEIAVIDTQANVKKQIKFVTTIDASHADGVMLEKLMGTYKDNCDQ